MYSETYLVIVIISFFSFSTREIIVVGGSGPIGTRLALVEKYNILTGKNMSHVV
jgi:hypothetical protein